MRKQIITKAYMINKETNNIFLITKFFITLIDKIEINLTELKQLFRIILKLKN